MGGGSKSQSQQSSQSTSTSRQALFTPSEEAITKSINQLLGIYQQSTAQLEPFTQTAFDATNDMRYWQGMSGIDPTVRSAAELRGQMETIQAPGKTDNAIVDIYGGPTNIMRDSRPGERDTRGWSVNMGSGLPGAEAFKNQKALMGNLTNVNQNLTLLNTEQDPTKRQALYDEAMKGFDTFSTTSQEIMKTFTQESAAGDYHTGAKTSSLGWDMATWIPHTSYYVDRDGTLKDIPVEKFLYNGKFDDSLLTIDPTTGKKLGGSTAEAQAGSQEFLKQVTKIDQLKAKVMSQFKAEGNPAPTPEQVMKRLESTPGYQVQFKAGINAIQNTQTAKGLFGSGRAGQELTRYGQEFASNALTNQYNRSAQLAGLTLPSVAQQSSNTVAQAAPIMASTQLAGSSWNMSPWTTQAQSTSQGTSSSSTSEGMGGLGSIFGAVLGGKF